LYKFFLGRAFATRVAFGIAGINYEDERITFEELSNRRGSTGFNPEFPLGAVPVLTLPDGKVVTQSGAIARYAAKIAKLYPEDPLEALIVDEIIETSIEVGTSIPQEADLDIRKKVREEFAATKLKKYYSFFASKISASSSGYVAGNTFSLADIYLYALLKAFRSGRYDNIERNYDSAWPEFQKYLDFVEANPVFAPYKL
jgi:glutathione S-transferase